MRRRFLTQRWHSEEVRQYAWGIAAAFLYLIAVAASHRAGLIPIRPLYDGLAPPSPYRWVRPPLEFRSENKTPEAGTNMLALAPEGSDPGSIVTGDGQAAVIFPQGAVAPENGETSIKVTITPLDPDAVVSARLRRRVTGNAYRIDAVYGGSGQPVTLRKPVTVLLRYPTHATEIWRSGEPAWAMLDATVFQVTLQLYAETTVLGTFAVAGEAARRPWVGALLQQPGVI
ncbi:MAG: hypothetical protein ACT4P5_19675, partial [Armatimonadota bacterium]